MASCRESRNSSNTFIFFAILHSPVSGCLQLLDQGSDLLPLALSQVFLFVFVEKQQKMNMLFSSEIQIAIAKSTSFPFLSCGISCSRLAHPSHASRHRASFRVLGQIRLYLAEHGVCVGSGQFMQSTPKGSGLDEYHSVIIPRCSSPGQARSPLAQDACGNTSPPGRKIPPRVPLCAVAQVRRPALS